MAASMKKIVLMEGDQFNRLTAVRAAGSDRKGYQLWVFRCECGTEKILRVKTVKNEEVRSCGCLRRLLYRRMGLVQKRTFTYKGETLSQAEWGRRLGKTRERVRQLQNEGRLKDYLDKHL